MGQRLRHGKIGGSEEMRKTIAVIFIVSIITTGCATQDLSVISQDPPVANNLHNTVSEEPKLAFESTTEIIYVDRPIFVPRITSYNVCYTKLLRKNILSSTTKPLKSVRT